MGVVTNVSTNNSLKQANPTSKIPRGGRGRLKLTHKNKLDSLFFPDKQALRRVLRSCSSQIIVNKLKLKEYLFLAANFSI